MQTVTSKDGTSIAFEQTGEGSPLILVGGAMSDRSGGAALAQHLASHFSVYTYDRRGRGDSGDTAPYAVQREVEDLGALIEHAGGSAFIYGMSSGAILSLLAAAAGLPITKLAVYEPPVQPGEAPAQPKPDPADHLTELVAAGRRGDAVEFFMTKVVGMPEPAVAQARNAPMWPGLEAIAHTLAYDLWVTASLSLRDGRLDTVTVPTLVIGGANSPAFLQQGVEAVAGALPNARRHVMEGFDHAVAPEALAPVLIDFFTTAGV